MKNENEISPELIAAFEEHSGAKVINTNPLQIEYEGKQWRPIMNTSDLLCASFDNEPILTRGESQWVDVNWKP